MFLLISKHSNTNPTHFSDQGRKVFLSPFALLKFSTFASLTRR
ncbi:hypothetical protein OIU84_028416 [Salix udensis]|uniref:Uncharacterized protein n=1 Tax=Salix udensis TaxID=889485 RepID=A0AAD6KE40_9ROSI|nr:hypothetical protein OIU84_028416 [Salix udensis]